MLALSAFATAGGNFALASHLDMSREVVSQLEAKGELKKSTEHDISSAIEAAQRVKLVSGVAIGLLALPLIYLLLALVLKFAAWLLGDSLPFSAGFTAVCWAGIPLALKAIIAGAAAVVAETVLPNAAERLVQSSAWAYWPNAPAKAAVVLQSADFFWLFGVVVLGAGYAAASGATFRRGLLVASGLFVIRASLLTAALVSMSGGGRPS